MYIRFFFKDYNQFIVMVTRKKTRNPAKRHNKLISKSRTTKASIRESVLFKVLRDDHKKLMGIMDNIERNSDDAEIVSELFSQMKEEIQIHSKAEDAAVYQPMKGNDDTRFLSVHAHEEYSLFDHLIAELSNIGMDDEVWMAKFIILKHEIEHHIEHEESEIFNKLKSDFSKKEIDMMAENMLTLKKEEMENIFIETI